MGRKRIVKTYNDTSASGDRTPIEGHRYFVRMELVSLKIEEKADAVGMTSELYFKSGGKGLLKFDQRTPTLGTIHLDLNENFTSNERLTLYSAFIEDKDGGSIEIPFKVYDQDMGKDDKLIDTQIAITLGANTEYFSFLEQGVKVKIGVSANRTRF